MIKDLFTTETARDSYLDPFKRFPEKESSFEIRRDGITGVTARILPFRPGPFNGPRSMNSWPNPPEKCLSACPNVKP